MNSPEEPAAPGRRGRFGRVISASRRADLPGCHPRELAARLRHIGPHVVHTLVLWTKNPAPILDEPELRSVLRDFESIFLHLTVTGLGGGPLEPGVPPWESVMGCLPRLLDLPGLGPAGVTLRFDPLVSVIAGGGERLTNMCEALFLPVATETARLGLTTVRTSIMTLYPKVERRLGRAGLLADPGLDARAEDFMRGVMEPACRSLGLSLLTCVNPDRGDPGCIDGKLLQRLHPRGLPCSLARDTGQRRGCHCTKALDIGSYRSCPHGCLYCYGNPVFPHDSPTARTC